MGGCEGGFWLWNSKKENEKDRQIEETENQAKTKHNDVKNIHFSSPDLFIYRKMNHLSNSQHCNVLSLPSSQLL